MESVRTRAVVVVAGKSDKPARAGKAKKGKKGAGAEGAAGGADGGAGNSGLILAEHPRAARSVARAKAWGGLGGFLIGGYLSLPTQTLAGAGLRALAAGMVCYVAVWAAAVFLWRRMLVAELHQAKHDLLTEELAKFERTRAPAAGGHVGRRPS
jgi:hypothetical protein